MPDHTHLFISIKPDVKISDLVRDIKSNSSAFLKETKLAISTLAGKKVMACFLIQNHKHRKLLITF